MTKGYTDCFLEALSQEGVVISSRTARSLVLDIYSVDKVFAKEFSRLVDLSCVSELSKAWERLFSTVDKWDYFACCGRFIEASKKTRLSEFEEHMIGILQAIGFTLGYENIPVTSLIGSTSYGLSRKITNPSEANPLAADRYGPSLRSASTSDRETEMASAGQVPYRTGSSRMIKSVNLVNGNDISREEHPQETTRARRPESQDDVLPKWSEDPVRISLVKEAKQANRRKSAKLSTLFTLIVQIALLAFVIYLFILAVSS